MNSPGLSRLACAGCGTSPPAGEPYPFRCPRAGSGDDVDHVVVRVLDLDRLQFPSGGSPHPFLRYRTLLHSYHTARSGGLADADFVRFVEDLDARVAAVDGRGMRLTPFAGATRLVERLGLGPGGGLRVKDETGGVAGSHKARHLFGLALHLEVAERLGRTSRGESDRRGLVIASCGNAALAAATIARAAGRPLTAFIPADANVRIVERLGELGTRTVVCERSAERPARDPGGDPCVLAFRRALDRGALPFCCQGNENGLTVEGGSTLAYEMVSALAPGERSPDRLFIQVGGGALASACVQGLRETLGLGALAALPRFHAVQTEGAQPLRRAYLRVRAGVLARLGLPPAADRTAPADDETFAESIRPYASGTEVQAELAYARAHRSEFMWPWESTPRSIAHGILDDETYDWHAVVTGMIESGGYPLTVSEDRLAEARDLARSTTAIAVDATGSAGLAGFLELRAQELHRPGETVGVLFTGAERQ